MNNITVADLIAVLNTCDPNARVRLSVDMFDVWLDNDCVDDCGDYVVLGDHPPMD